MYNLDQTINLFSQSTNRLTGEIHMAFKGGAGWLKRKNNLQTVQEWKFTEFTVLHVHPAVQKAEFPTYTIFIL